MNQIRATIFFDKNSFEQIFYSTQKKIIGHLLAINPYMSLHSYLAGHIGIYGPLMEQSEGQYQFEV